MIAKRYAQALYELCKEENVTDVLLDELRIVKKYVMEERDLQRLLFHPQISSEEKKSIWIKLFQGKAHVLTLNFLLLLTDRKRETFLVEIVEELENIIREEKNITVAQVTTAIELAEKQKEALQLNLAKMTGKKQIELKTKVDPKIIGGIIIKIGNLLIDDSVVRHLASLRKKFQDIQLKGIGVNG